MNEARADIRQHMQGKRQIFEINVARRTTKKEYQFDRFIMLVVMPTQSFSMFQWESIKEDRTGSMD